MRSNQNVVKRFGGVWFGVWLLAAIIGGLSGRLWAEEPEAAEMPIEVEKKTYGSPDVKAAFEKQIKQRVSEQAKTTEGELITEPVAETESDAMSDPPTPKPTFFIPAQFRKIKNYGYQPDNTAVFSAEPRATPEPTIALFSQPETELITEPVMEEDAPSANLRCYAFTAKFDQTQSYLDESLTLTVEAAVSDLKRLGAFQLPALPQFKLINEYQNQNSYTNQGKIIWVRSKQYVYIVQEPGKYTLPPIQMYYGGRKYATAPLQVNIQGSRSGIRYKNPFSGEKYRANAVVPGAPEMEKADKNEVEMTATLSQATVFVNQQVIATVRLKYQEDEKTKISYRPPRFKDFLTESLMDHKSEELIMGGKQRFVDVSYRTALFPVRAGKLEMEIAQANLTVQNINHLFLSEPLTLEVLPLPPDPAPLPGTGTNGLVGQYQLFAEWEQTSVETDSPFRIQFVLQGTGNIRSAPDPKVPAGSHYQFYLEGKEEKLVPQTEAVSGERRYHYLVVFKTPGKVTLEPAQIRYFDPLLRQWQSAEARLPQLTVQPRAGEKQMQSQIQRNKGPLHLRPNRFKLGTLRPAGTWVVRQPGFWIIQGIGPLAWLMIWIIRVMRQRMALDPAALRVKRAYPQARRAMRQLKSSISRRENQKFYDGLARTANEYLASKFGLPQRYIGLERLPDFFEQHEIPNALRTRFKAALTACEYVRYAAVVLPSKDMQSLHRDLLDAIHEFERYWSERSRRGTPPAAALMLLGLGLWSGAQLGYAGETEVNFMQANQAADQGDYLAAEKAYQRVIELNVEDPVVYYNLGNVYLRQNKLGAAILAYERGLRLAPRDADIKYNLAQAEKWAWKEPSHFQTPGWIRRLQGAYLGFTPNELAWAAAVCYYVALVIGLWLWLRPQPWAWRKPVIAGAAGLALLFGGWSAARHYETKWWQRAIVTTPTTQVFNRPYSQAEVVYTLPEGTRVVVTQDEQSWVEIVFGSQRQGWIQRSTLGFVE